MYFPYLYGKSAELLALRELSSSLGNPQRIWPVIEPTKPSEPLKKTLAKLKAGGAGAYLIVNPIRGDLASPPAAAAWFTSLASEIADPSVVRPALLVTATTSPANVLAFARAYPGREIGIVLHDNSVAPADLATALTGTAHTVFLGRLSNRPAYEAALGTGVTVDIEDNFVPQARNADYSGDDPQGVNHLTWQALGKKGFGDYTILPSAYSDKGGPMGALAIHLTFETAAELRVQHFISTIVAQNSPLPPKFKEAIAALQVQLATTPTRFRSTPSIAEYIRMQSAGKYTSAERNKRLQISHHLYTVGKHLGI